MKTFMGSAGISPFILKKTGALKPPLGRKLILLGQIDTNRCKIMSPPPFLSLHQATGYCPPLTDISRPPRPTLDGHPPAFSFQTHQLQHHQADTHPLADVPTYPCSSGPLQRTRIPSHTVSTTSASCQRGPSGEEPPRTGMHTRLERQIASKVIDRTPREGGEPVQLQSLRSLQEISHGQSELELRRGETWEMMLHSVLAKKNFLKRA